MRTLSTARLALAAAAGLLLAPPPAGAQPAPPAQAAPGRLVPFEAVNAKEPQGDRLAIPRRIAAAVVAEDNGAPKRIVDVGSFTGEFLEAFMDQFPSAHGQWTEPVTTNEVNAKRRLARFGDHVDYVIGCPDRDLAKGCVPAGVDVLITSWLSIHQNLDGIRRFYREAAAKLPPGGWVVNLDHVYVGDPWGRRLTGARQAAVKEGLASLQEGPPLHHPDWKIPTLDDQIAALKAAGVDDVQVVWRRFDTVLIMGRKR
jgi:hypothetical protein